METIMVSMINKKNSRMIGELLKGHNLIYKDKPSYDDDFDLLIIDTPSWSKISEDMKKRKEKEKSVFLPYLLVSTTSDLKMVPKEVWEDFDEVITIPISKTVLMSRVNILLKTRNLSLQVNQLLQDKEMLMKEIHHRVKNNLTVISSLLSIQASYIKDKETRDIFKEAENRARSMALIHERLYSSESLKNIEFSEYIQTLVQDLFHNYSTSADKIRLEIDVDRMDMDINTSIPLGLIINEMVSNALKYAFPQNKTGFIKIGLHHESNEYILEVSDNGVGLPEDFNADETDTLGMLLINSLVRQLDGSLELKREPGTSFRITFPQAEYSE